MKLLSRSALLGALLLAACTKVSDTSPGAPATGLRHPWTHPGELRIAIQSEPVTLNPVLSANTTEGLLNRLSFDTLVSVKADGKTLVPILATTVPTVADGGISHDGLTITYHLRSGVKWQDGVPFSSKDVKFTWQAMMNDGNNVNERVGYEDVRSVDTPDARTVVFHLKHKFAPFVNTVFSESDSPVCIVPEHILGKYKDVNRVPFNELPIGTGPFKVVRWVRGDHIELTANPDYFMGAPKLKTIVVREVPDENTSINELRTHDVDWLFEPSPNLYNVLKTLPDTTIHLVDQPGTLRLLINLQRPAFQDIRVRHAIAYAIDKKSLVDRLTGGSARVAGADQAPFSWAYRADVASYGRGRRQSAGTADAGGLQRRSRRHLCKNGRPLSFELSTNSANATRRLVQTQVQACCKPPASTPWSRTTPATSFSPPTVRAASLPPANTTWPSTAGSPGSIRTTIRSCLHEVPPRGANYSRYCSAAMDRAQAAALASYDEPPRKKATNDSGTHRVRRARDHRLVSAHAASNQSGLQRLRAKPGK